MHFKQWLNESSNSKRQTLLNLLAGVTAGTAAMSLGLDQLDSFGININDIIDLINHAKLSAQQIKILTTTKEKMELRDKCFTDPKTGKDFHIRKSDQIQACEKYCNLTKDEKACNKAGITVFPFRGGKKLIRNPLSNR